MLRPSRPPSDQPRSRLALFSLGLALLVGLLLRLWLAGLNAGITMDSPRYVGMAEAIAQGERMPGPAHHGYPALIAVTALAVSGREWPGRVVSLVAGMAVLLLVHALARRTLSPGWATLAVWLVALHPLAAVYSGAIMTESTVLALFYGSLLLIETRRFGLGGTLLGASYVVRPDALALALFAVLFSGGGRRGALWVLAGFAVVLIPYLGYLRWERGTWMLTPKTVLVRPAFEAKGEAEWRVGASRDTDEGPRALGDRIRWAAPSIARHYRPGLQRHLALLRRAWPWPWVALSVAGWVVWRRALLAPIFLVVVLPLLTVPFEARFSLLLVPALAVFAANGGSWLTARLAARVPRVSSWGVAIAAFGAWWVWSGPIGLQARYFDDGPMAQMREAGAWLADHARPGTVVMDRKAYVPFFAGLEHIQLPNDDYDTILDFARRSGADFLVVEEYVVATLRPQLLRLVQDRDFRLREKRVRQAFVTGTVPMTGVAVFEVVRDSVAAP